MGTVSNSAAAIALWTEQGWVGIYDEDQNLITEGTMDLETVTRCFPEVETIEISPRMYRQFVLEIGAPRSLRDFPLDKVW